MNKYKKYLVQNPKSGVWYGLWACRRPSGKYVGITPGGLIERIFELCGKPQLMLEPFGGTSHISITTDINRSVKPTILADAHNLPFKDKVFDLVFLDPPYEIKWYKSKYFPEMKKVKIYRVLSEAARTVKEGGYIALLHFLVPKHIDRDSFARFATIGITTGPNKRIRCLTIFRRKNTLEGYLK